MKFSRRPKILFGYFRSLHESVELIIFGILTIDDESFSRNRLTREDDTIDDSIDDSKRNWVIQSHDS